MIRPTPIGRLLRQMRAPALCAAIALLRCTPLESRSDFVAAGGSPESSGGSSSGPSGGGGAAGATSRGGTSNDIGGMSSNAGSSPTPDAGAAGQSCFDPNGLSGLGCGTCPPDNLQALENACTDATCVPFADKARLPQLLASGELPPLPTDFGSAGAPAAVGAGGEGGASSSFSELSAGVGGDPTSVGGAVGSGGTSASGGSSSVACDGLADPENVLYVTGSSAAKPFLQQIAQQLVGSGSYLVYLSAGSCFGVDAVLHGSPLTTGAAPAPAASATYWDSAASTGKPCALPPQGVSADLGVSDVFAQTCPGFELANLETLSIRDAHGPIQTMTLAVPATSPYHEISAAAAYFAFGFGKLGEVLDPAGHDRIWNDESLLFQRNASSGTQAMIGRAIGLLPGSFRGASQKSSDDMAASLQTAKGDALGILAADYIDSRNLRAQIHVLAFQDTGQVCSFYPDSTSTARDKRNVRDGHYPIWGPLHLLYKIDGSGNPIDAQKRKVLLDVLGYLTGSQALPNGVSLFDVYAQNGLIPECAMHVSRTQDGGNVRSFQPENPCGCLFEARATGSTDCTPCTVQGQCPGGKACSFGYCED